MDVPEGIDAAVLQANFWWMSVCFAVNHGTVTTPLVVATSLLGKNVANVGNGTLYVFTLLSSLFVAAPLTSIVGLKGSLLLAMLFYCIYVGGFACAALFSGVQALTWFFFLAGSVCGGLAAGVLWTAQGGYFANTASRIAEARGETREAVTGDLAGKFAFVYLLFEVGSKLAFSGLQGLGLPPALIGFLFLAVGALALLGMTRVYKLTAQSPRVAILAKLGAVTSLWSDPLIWLLSPTNLTFGFCAAFMNGYVNGNFASQELGKSVVGFLAAITAATAAVLAQLYGLTSTKFGKGPVIVFGAVCFLCIPLCLFVLHCCGGWGWWLLILYFLQGSGRAVYESTNRAMFSDFFTGSATEGAFANCMFQSSLSFAISFFLQTALSPNTLAAIVLVLASLTPLSYGGALALQKSRARKAARDELLATQSDSRTLGA
mmetsp:Transcript_48594/g.150487  ORF Transcript_48594/g.150487 Transcript_48594/m.150487 type:complete len:432 (+) Transcript_48594:56-1351(+)|eukprot:CAMPEP_0175337894 /NCGR_PEP_ID=MMETSP0095-20121207/4561_1 /TAXON_ID=311494 /ORGANISM="Alexandrium monilatum, Strain CCMP3105" /LENGTH=431 /DNA_ID=CAMNT_0016635293 /DNA_START=34 /DNA_END=1329 /DNA_ORIENTATION=+